MILLFTVILAVVPTAKFLFSNLWIVWLVHLCQLLLFFFFPLLLYLIGCILDNNELKYCHGAVGGAINYGPLVYIYYVTLWWSFMDSWIWWQSFCSSMISTQSFNESRTSPIVIYDPKSSFAKLFQLHYMCVCFWQSCNFCFRRTEQSRRTCITFWSKFHCSMNLCEGRI